MTIGRTVARELLARSPGGAGWRAMWQWTHSRGSAAETRQHTRKHLVQVRDAQRVKIAAGINRAIHAAGLLGRHVGEGAGNDLHRCAAAGGHSRGSRDATPG